MQAILPKWALGNNGSITSEFTYNIKKEHTCTFIFVVRFVLLSPFLESPKNFLGPQSHF